MNILVIGSINKDIVLSVDHIVNDGETISCSEQALYLGGKGLNQTIALGNSANNVYFYCNINENDIEIIEQLNTFSFNTKYVKKVKQPTGTAFIQVNKDGENAIVISKNANSEIDLDIVKSILDELESDTTVVLQNEINDLNEIITICKNKGVQVVLNPSPITSDITFETLRKVDYLIANQIEFQSITGKDNIETGIKFLKSNDIMTKLVITLGSKGAMYIDDNETIFVEGNKVDVVDTTCAGDTFLGFFIGSVTSGNSIKHSLDIANKAASLCVQTKGASVSIPSLQKVNSI